MARTRVEHALDDCWKSTRPDVTWCSRKTQMVRLAVLAAQAKDQLVEIAWRTLSGMVRPAQHPLAQQDERLLQSIRADRARRSDEWTAWDGRLAELNGWSPTGQTWSVTTMENFHQCHLRILLKSVLGAYPSELADETSSSLRFLGTGLRSNTGPGAL